MDCGGVNCGDHAINELNHEMSWIMVVKGHVACLQVGLLIMHTCTLDGSPLSLTLSLL